MTKFSTEAWDNYQVGGSLPADAPSYVRRASDDLLYEALRTDKFCYVLNSRQMGKSSLKVQTIQRLQSDGVACAALDLTRIGAADITAQQWYSSVIDSIVGSLDLYETFDLYTWWEEHRLLSNVRRLDKFIEEILLTSTSQKIVIFIDEIDSVIGLPFKLGDFFALVRECYNRRANHPDYARLTFVLLGVTTLSDLMQGQLQTPFNIGQEIALEGFQIHECESLVQGLAAKSSNPQAVIQAVLTWTGGQPFLTQKVCKLVLNENSMVPVEQEEAWVADLVHARVIENWEAQDTPEHLKTIRDRVLHSEEKGRGRLLGLYQQVLDSDGIISDDSYEQMQLRLTGLVVKRDRHLVVYNPIYAAVFNQQWVAQALSDLRPDFYSSAFLAWCERGEQQTSFLLRDQALVDAEVWAKDKRLSDADYKFLAASRELDNQVVLAEVKLNAEKQKTRIAIAGGIIASILLGFASWQLVLANKNAEVANENAEIIVDNAVKKVEDLFQKNYQLDALIESIETMSLMKTLGKTNNKVVIEKLYKVIANIQERNQLKSHNNQIWSLSISPDGKKIISGSFDNTIKLWNVEGKLLDTKDQKRRQWKAKFSHDGQLIASVNDDNSISLWNVQNDKLQLIDPNIIKDTRIAKPVNVRDRQIYDLEFSHTGQMIAFSSVDGNIRILKKNSNISQASCIEGKGDNGIYNISFHPQNNIVAYACNEGVYIWDISKSNSPQLISNSRHDGTIGVVKYSSSGDILASASQDGIIKIWNTKDNYKQAGEIRPKVSLSYLMDISFDSNNNFIASSYTNANIGIKIWNLEKTLKSYPQPLQEAEEYNLLGHTQTVGAVIFNPTDPSMIISASSDSSIRIWTLNKPLINQTEVSIIKLLNRACSLGKDYLNLNKTNVNKIQDASRICQDG